MAKLKVGFNDLASLFPHIAAELIGENPSEILANSPRKFWWRCFAHGHKYFSRCDHRTRSNVGCPYCANKKVLAGFNDLATTHPDIAGELVDVDPSTILAGTGKSFKWRCAAYEHEYVASSNSRTTIRAQGKRNGCPVCSNRRVVAGFNDLATTHPEFAAQLFEDDPTTVTAGSSKRVLWRCSNHDMPYIAAIVDRVNDRWGCGICKGYQIVPGFNDLATTHPESASQLFADDPTTLTAGSHKKVLWQCCQHPEPYEASVANHVLGRGCGFCRGFKVLPGFNDMATTDPQLAAEIVGIDPTTIVAGAKKRYTWKCSRCAHMWSASSDARASGGSGCPACAPRGYDPTQPGYFYLLARQGEQQFGITSSISRRLKQHQAKGDWELVDVAGPFDGQQTFDTERFIKAWLKNTIGLLTGTKENWSTANLEISNLTELFTQAGVPTPRSLRNF